MNLFKDCVAYQEEVRDPTRICEVLARVIAKAKRLSGPAQINIPRDFWTQVIDIDIPEPVEFETSPGGTDSIAKAAQMLSEAKFPVILNGAGVVLAAGGIAASRVLAERLDAPVCVGYQHNDAFPAAIHCSRGLWAITGQRPEWSLSARPMSCWRWGRG